MTRAEPAGTRRSAARQDFKMLGYWISLGAAAGGLGGALVGGVGGRLAMLLLRFTSDDAVRGLKSDDGFIIGRFNFLDTMNLVITTAVMGALVGLLMAAGRPFLPTRGMPLAWGGAGALMGAQIFIDGGGVDFTAVGPRWLGFALFMLLPAAGAFVIAWLISQFPRFWWRNRTWTAIAAIAALPAIILLPVILVVGGLWFTALRLGSLRAVGEWRPVRVAAIVVFALVVALGALGLTEDARAIL